MKKNKTQKMRSYSLILKRELRQRLKQEKPIKMLIIFAFIYTLISNIISKCCPIGCSPQYANIGNALDELAKNVCYSIIAGIIFYIINDVYKNAVKRIPEMDAMFHELHKLQANACYMLQALCDDNYDKTKNREQMFLCVMKHLCNGNKEIKTIGSLFKVQSIKVEDCAILIDKWKEANKLRCDFLGAYGDLLTREEIYRLSSFDDNLVRETIGYIDMHINGSYKEFVEIRECDITIIVNRIVNYKVYLTDLTKKYIHYAYRVEYLNRPCIEEDIM